MAGSRHALPVTQQVAGSSPLDPVMHGISTRRRGRIFRTLPKDVFSRRTWAAEYCAGSLAVLHTCAENYEPHPLPRSSLWSLAAPLTIAFRSHMREASPANLLRINAEGSSTPLPIADAYRGGVTHLSRRDHELA